jgi:Spy/CpxP family protein refolding chaperone
MTAERAPRMVRLTTALLLVATFAAGSLTGAAIYRFAAPRMEHRGPPPPGMLPLDRLGLSPEQEAQAHAIMERYRPELDAVMREGFPKVRAIQERMQRDLDGILTPEQRKLAAALEQERRSRFGPPGAPPGHRPGMGPPPAPPPDTPPPAAVPPPVPKEPPAPFPSP